MNPRHIFHTCLLITNLLLFCLILSISIIGTLYTPKGKERVWICSKILTMKKLLKDFPFDNTNNCISENNFIFDQETYDEEYDRSLVGEHHMGSGTGTRGGGYGGGGGGGLGGGGGGFRRSRKIWR